MKKYFILLIIPFCLIAQDITPNTITIDASASVSVPADMISFTINLSSESDSAQYAFRKHLAREKKIVEIIKEYKIDSSDVFYSLLSIRKQQNRDGGIVYHTMQTVNINLRDIDKYYDFQLSLLINDLDQFSARFSVKNEKDLIEIGYKKALKIATADAKLLAAEIKKKLGVVNAILSRSHSDEIYEFSSSAMRAPRSGLLDINQIVSKRINLTVMFELYQ